MGMVTKTLKVIIRASAGAKKKIFMLTNRGNRFSLEKSLMASLKGCSVPA